MRLASLLTKEIIQFSRDRVILILILWLYTIEVVICAYALSFDVKHLPLAAVDLDRSVASQSLLEKFSISEAFDVAGYPSTMAVAGNWLDGGKASLV